jgi:uncharacterized membrane protein YhiD involved in acid resistance
VPVPADTDVVRLTLAAALGMFLGLERKWPHKPAGIRTFSLPSLVGAVFTLLDTESLLVIGDCCSSFRAWCSPSTDWTTRTPTCR